MCCLTVVLLGAHPHPVCLLCLRGVPVEDGSALAGSGLARLCPLQRPNPRPVLAKMSFEQLLATAQETRASCSDPPAQIMSQDYLVFAIHSTGTQILEDSSSNVLDHAWLTAYRQPSKAAMPQVMKPCVVHERITEGCLWHYPEDLAAAVEVPMVGINDKHLIHLSPNFHRCRIGQSTKVLTALVAASFRQE